MKKVRDSEKTREAILEAASHEFAEKGFHGTNLSIIARRAKLSKQLLNYHFPSKEALLSEVHAKKFRPSMQWQDTVAEDPSELIVRNFQRRAQEPEYIRYLTWEAASWRTRKLPRENVRRARVKGYGAAVRRLQKNGLISKDLDPQLLHLAILCLSTYPLAFSQMTEMVTGTTGDNPDFQKRWSSFMALVGAKLMSKDSPAVAKRARPTQRKV